MSDRKYANVFKESSGYYVARCNKTGKAVSSNCRDKLDAVLEANRKGYLVY